MTQFLTNCTSLSLDQLKNKNLAISISAMICFLLTAMVLFLLFLYRVYRTPLQRLFQYLTVVTLLHLAFISMDIHLRFDFSHKIDLCKWLGFIRQWTATMTYFFVLVITIYLMYKIYRQLRRKGILFSNGPQHKIVHLLIEAVTVVCVVLLPLTFLWVPFYHGTYGIYSTSCWIQKVDIHCNKSIGSIEQIAFTTILRIVMIVVLTSFAVLSVLFCRFACRYHQTRRTHLRTVRQTFLLMCFFALSSLIEITGLIMYVYSAISGKNINSYTFWLVYDIAMPFSQLVIPSGFLVYLYSFKRFSREELKKSTSQWRDVCTGCCVHCKKSTNSSSDFQNHDLLCGEEGTAPSSDRVSALSDTYFSIKYTGAFTDISNMVATTSNHDTGYGSVCS